MPQECSSQKCFQFASLSYAGLARAEQLDGKLKFSGELAKSWKTDKNETTISLRDATWSTGQKLVAQDFVRSVRQILSFPARFPTHPLLFALKNAKNFSEGRVGWEAVGIQAKDPTTLRIATDPGTDVELFLSQPIFWPLPPLRVYRATATLGPFLAPVKEAASRLRFVRNPQFAGVPALLDELLVSEVADPAARVELFLQGETDMVDEIEGDVPSLLASRLRASSTMDLVVLAFRPSRRPFQHRTVREAFRETIDRDELAGALPTEALPAQVIWEHGRAGGLKEWLPRFTLEDSRQKLAVYRFGSELFRSLEGTALKPFANPTLSFRDVPCLRTSAENLRAQWSKKLGVLVELVPRQLETSWFHAPQSMSLLVLQRSLSEPSSWSLNRWADDLARSTGIVANDLKGELPILDEWWVRRHAVAVPLFNLKRPYLMADRASNIELTPGNFWDFRKVDISG